MPLIKREAAKSLVKKHSASLDRQDWSGRSIIALLEAVPTIDPIRAAGGCRCGDCAAYEGHICKNTGFYKSETGWCNDGVSREAQDDG